MNFTNGTKPRSGRINENEENIEKDKEKQIFKVKNLKSEIEADDSGKPFNEELVFIDPRQFKVDENSFGPPLDDSGNDICKIFSFVYVYKKNIMSKSF